MSVFGTLLAMIAPIALIYGLFAGLFLKGRRKRGWFIAAISLFVALPISSVLIELEEEGQIGTELQAQAEITETTPAATTDETDPSPTRSYPAVLRTPRALQAYCHGLELYDAMIAEADDRFGVEGSDARYQWIESQDEQITAKITKAIGVEFSEWSDYAYENGWDHRCDALDSGFKQVELKHIKSADHEDRKRVEEAVTLNLIQRLDANEGPPFFDNNIFKAVRCRYKNFGGVDILGCKLIGGIGAPIKQTGAFFYTAASVIGTPVAVPLDSTAEGLATSPSLHDVENRTIPMGKYVGPYPLPGVDWAEVKGYFKG